MLLHSRMRRSGKRTLAAPATLQPTYKGLRVGDGGPLWRISSAAILAVLSALTSNAPVSAQTLVPNGTYAITNQASGLVLASQSSSALIDQSSLTGTSNERWQLTNLGNNTVSLINSASGLALEVLDSSTGTGGSIDESAYTAANNQIWEVVSKGNSQFVLVNKNSGLALDDPGWSLSPGTDMDQWTANGGANQNWRFSSFTIAAAPVDPRATPATKALYSYIRSNYQTNIISGQTDQDTFDTVYKLTGKYPLIRDYDMQPYSPEYSYSWSNTAINPNTGQPGWFTFGPDSSNPNTPNAINWYLSNSGKPIIDWQWHWHSPMGGIVGTNTFDASNTTFDVAKAVIPRTPQYNATIRDIDAIAVQLQKLNAAGVPIIWRPLHEAEGGGFWWDAKGPKAYIALWNLMYNRLVNYHGLHNLIWAWTGDDPAWYPGNDIVDILGIDSYPGNDNYETNQPEYDKVLAICGGTKIIAMTENGPIPDINSSLSTGAPWAFFMSWYDVTIGNDNNHLISVFNSPNVITLENTTR